MVKSSNEPTCEVISFIKVAVSPVNEAYLAFSRFNCLPVNNSASNSLAIEDSQFNIDSPIASICSKVVPSLCASVTDFAISV